MPAMANVHAGQGECTDYSLLIIYYLSVTREHLLLTAKWLLDIREHLLLNINYLSATREFSQPRARRKEKIT